MKKPSTKKPKQAAAPAATKPPQPDWIPLSAAALIMRQHPARVYSLAVRGELRTRVDIGGSGASVLLVWRQDAVQYAARASAFTDA